MLGHVWIGQAETAGKVELIVPASINVKFGHPRVVPVLSRHDLVFIELLLQGLVHVLLKSVQDLR